MLAKRLFPACTRIPYVIQKIGQIRESSFKSSLFLEDISPKPREYEVTKNPVDWDYVQRLLPNTVVPEPVKKDKYPSGWKPQAENLSELPYFVQRTRNHMIPCYLRISHLKTRRTTLLKNIKGDIWLLEKEIKDFLRPQNYQPIRSQVNEFAGFIRINGDHVNAIKYFLENKGM
ncbi:unnamed protein product [Ceutorhynchus assimilis]|uniref:Large ribosomal subunit protein mL49 n=1 Tax=Ceutorhynchus assimilis TaxID=467358 RepID=A0A9N9QKG2_9CUCU|nr:unnamed protein product [Ceutorhynchus assimilis]